MKTKAQIVQRLLDEKKIDAEEAVVLLMSEKEFIPYPQPYPIYPVSPYRFFPSPITIPKRSPPDRHRQ